MVERFSIAIALLFNGWIWYCRGEEEALTFLAAYLVEKSLSVDNLFVILLIFNSFQIRAEHLHKVLFLGLLGAMVFRAFFIIGGLALVGRFEWILFVFGAILVAAGVKLALQRKQEIHPRKEPGHPVFDPSFSPLHRYGIGPFFCARGNDTPLSRPGPDRIIRYYLCLGLASGGICHHPRPVFGLHLKHFCPFRAKVPFFTVQGLLDRFHYLHYGLAFILIFIGTKMLIDPWIHVPIEVCFGSDRLDAYPIHSRIARLAPATKRAINQGITTRGSREPPLLFTAGMTFLTEETAFSLNFSSKGPLRNVEPSGISERRLINTSSTFSSRRPSSARSNFFSLAK